MGAKVASRGEGCRSDAAAFAQHEEDEEHGREGFDFRRRRR